MLRLSLALCLLSAAALALTRPDATEPSRFAIKHLSESLRESFPSLNQSFADEVARQQLRWIIRNPNATDYEAVREPRPMFAECPELPARSPPTNIKDLHPQDVKVMGAVGDSISTGCNALSSTWLNLKDYQGLAWSMGGDAGAVTLLNLMRQYNPEIVGASTGTGSGNTGLNHAKNGAVVQDVPGQVDALIANMQAREDVDFENDWKVVTLLIGGNNLCIVCKADKEKENNAEVYEHYLRESLQKLSTLPRTLVNVVQHTVYTQLAQFKGPLCGLVLPSVCDCLTTTNAAKQQAAEKAIVEFNEVGVKVAAEFQRRDDFAVVIQPFLEKTVIPDNSWISTADCFHPSGEGQRLFATGLWNGMLTPVPKKADYTAAIDDVPMCADADTLLYN